MSRYLYRPSHSLLECVHVRNFDALLRSERNVEILNTLNASYGRWLDLLLDDD